jgi:serine/threonine protein kinase
MDLLRRMTAPDPTQRLNFEQILQHPWVVNNL